MGHAFTSPLRRWEVLAGLCEQMGAKTFVEVGCREGRTTGFLLENLPDLNIIAIDPWAPIANADEDYKEWDFAKIEREFWENIGSHRNRLTMHTLPSWDAASVVDAGSVDIAFIDAGHDYDSCLEDIRIWWPKVRDGGYLTGHDYQHKFPGVMRAVAKAFPLLRVAVCPDSVWVVQKDADMHLKAA